MKMKLSRGELNMSNNNQDETFHDLNDIISIDGSENKEMFKDAPLDFDPAYPPMDKWIKSHPKEQVIGDPLEGVLNRAQLRAKNEVLNAHQEFYMLNVFILKIEPKSFKATMEHSD